MAARILYLNILKEITDIENKLNNREIVVRAIAQADGGIHQHVPRQHAGAGRHRARRAASLIIRTTQG